MLCMSLGGAAVVTHCGLLILVPNVHNQILNAMASGRCHKVNINILQGVFVKLHN